MGAPFLSHMATMAGTGLLIARHGPLLASAVLLPPGAAVLELLPYKWEWRDVSSLYYNMTQSTGQLHHWAWRPLDAKWCRWARCWQNVRVQKMGGLQESAREVPVRVDSD
jgi:hypothetical protein